MGGGGFKRGITLVGNYVININMADDEKSPLLQSADEDEGPRLRHHHTFPTLHKGLDLSPDSPSESDHIVCVFVVTFDTRSGMARYCCHNIYMTLYSAVNVQKLSRKNRDKLFNCFGKFGNFSSKSNYSLGLLIFRVCVHGEFKVEQSE